MTAGTTGKKASTIGTFTKKLLEKKKEKQLLPKTEETPSNEDSMQHIDY